MRFAQLVEQERRTQLYGDKITTDNVYDLYHRIKRECAPWYKEAGNKFAYRGEPSGIPIFIGVPRVPRKPKDTPKIFQDTVDAMLQRLGFKALRSNSIFVSGSKLTAEKYGTSFVIFPIGNFNYTWNRHYPDLMGLWRNLKNQSLTDYNTNDHIDTFDLLDIDSTYLEQLKKDAIEYKKDLIKKTSIPYSMSAEEQPQFIQSEIQKFLQDEGAMKFTMFQLLYLKSFGDAEAAKRFKFDIDKFIQYFGKDFSNKTLFRALQHEHEIYLNCSKYYAINSEVFNTYFKDLFYGIKNPE